MANRALYKTTIVVWSEFDGQQVELEELAREATKGAAYCSRYRSELVAEPLADEAAPDQEFFNLIDD